MAGIVLESIAACRRATNCLRILRVSQHPFVLCPSVVSLQHRYRRHSSFDGPSNDNGKDVLNPKKPIRLGQGQLAKDSDGSQVTAAPPDPKDPPGEKRTELPYEIRPEIPMEIKPNHMPLEIKPPNPHPIICTTDNETLSHTDGATEDADLIDIVSEAKSSNISNDSLPPPVINLMDDQTPYTTTTEPNESLESPYISIESDLNYSSANVNEFVNVEELTSQGSSSNDPDQNESKSDLGSQDVSLSKSGPNEPYPENRLDINPSLDLKVKPQEGSLDFQSNPLADNLELRSRPQLDAVGSGWSQGSSFDFPGEGNIAAPEAKIDPIICSTATDGYDSQRDPILGKDKEEKKAPIADKIREHVVDNEVIDQWVDKFKRLYMAENAAFGLDNDKEIVALSDKINSDSKDEKDKKHLQTMVMNDNKWVYENKDSASPSSSATDESSSKDTIYKNSFPSMVKKNNVWVFEDKNTVEPSSSITDKSIPEDQKEDTKWVFENKDSLENIASPSDHLRSSHEGDFPLDIEETQKTSSNKIDENASLNIAAIENADTIENVTGPSNPGGALPQDIEAKHKAPKDDKDAVPTAKPTSPSPEPTLAFDPEGTLPLIIGGKQEATTSKKDLHASDKNASSDENLILDQPPTAAKSEDESSESSTGDSQKSPVDISSTFDFNSDPKVNDDNTIQSSSDFKDMGQEKSSSQSTEEIVSMIDKDFSDELNETKDSEPLVKFTIDSQADVLGMSEDNLHQDQEDKAANDYFSQILDFEETTSSHVNVLQEDQQEDQFISSSVDMETSEMHQTNFTEKTSSFIKATNEASDSSELNQESVPSTDELKSILPNAEQTVNSHTDLYDPISHEVSTPAPMVAAELEESEDSDSSELNQESVPSTVELKSILPNAEQTVNSHTETTSILPDDLYDPISHEVSTPAPMEAAELEESEDLSPGPEAPEAKMEETQATEEIKTDNTENASTAEKAVKKEKPQLEQGELSMKLLDRDSAEAPTSAETPTKTETPPKAETPAKTEAPKKAERVPSLGAESQTAGEKSLIQKLFEKILGGRGKNDGKRQMSTYTIQRQLSTTCTFAIPPSCSPNGAKNVVTMELFHEDNQELKPDHDAPAKVILPEPDMSLPVLDLLEKNSEDLTEIKGGSPSCSSPKKPPRELLQEKLNSKKIKILGGSEECAKKMKRIKELTKETDDDCDRDHFSISQFLRQLRVSFAC